MPSTSEPDPELMEKLFAADDQYHVGYASHLCQEILATHPHHTVTLIFYAENLIALARYDDAIAVLDLAESTCLKKFNYGIKNERGHLERKRGRLSEAKALYLEAHELRSHDATALIYAGVAAFTQGEVAEAEQFARTATQCSKGCIDEAYFNLGGYLLSQERYAEARDCYRRAIEIDPDDRIAIRNLTDVEQVLAAIAERSSKQALALVPSEPTIANPTK